jgi:alpha-tubulin suppressor-like RCC1 family protein
VDLAGTSHTGAAALKSDGTLWNLPARGDPSQIGSSSDWKKVVARGSWFLALKQDGTIWGWGIDSLGILSNRTDEEGHGLKFPEPVEIWPEPDWADILVPTYLQAVAVKRDGSLWKWGYRMDVSGRAATYNDYHQLVPADIGGGNWSSLAGSFLRLIMGVRTDGSVWAGAPNFEWQPQDVGDLSLFGTHIPKSSSKQVGELVRIGTKSDWVAVSLAGQRFLALEADGTFWAIDYYLGKTRRPSKYHDWLAAAGTREAIWTLAKDGTISCWADFSREEPFGPEPYSTIPLFHLRPSRRPLASINILDAK